jgi:hypothetical protein
MCEKARDGRKSLAVPVTLYFRQHKNTVCNENQALKLSEFETACDVNIWLVSFQSFVISFYLLVFDVLCSPLVKLIYARCHK